MRNLIHFIVKNYFVLLFLVLEAVSIVFIFQFNPYQKSIFSNLSRNVNGFFYNELGEVREFFYLKKENQLLHEENARLRNTLSRNFKIVTVHVYDSLNSDSITSDALWQHYFLTAEVVNNSVNKPFNYITLNRGRKQGLEKDMAVISNGGVVGIVMGVSDNFSTVIPVLNRDFRLGSEISGTGHFGVLEWDAKNPETALLNEIPLHVDVQKGDSIVTSGYSAIFPPGLKVGTVESMKVKEGNFYEIRVNLEVDFRTLQHVLIIGNSYRKEKLELEKSFGYD